MPLSHPRVFGEGPRLVQQQCWDKGRSRFSFGAAALTQQLQLLFLLILQFGVSFVFL